MKAWITMIQLVGSRKDSASALKEIVQKFFLAQTPPNPRAAENQEYYKTASLF